MTLESNIFETCKEQEIAGYPCYVFEIDSNTAIELIKELGESLTVTPKDFGI